MYDNPEVFLSETWSIERKIGDKKTRRQRAVVDSIILTIQI